MELLLLQPLTHSYAKSKRRVIRREIIDFSQKPHQLMVSSEIPKNSNQTNAFPIHRCSSFIGDQVDFLYLFIGKS